MTLTRLTSLRRLSTVSASAATHRPNMMTRSSVRRTATSSLFMVFRHYVHRGIWANKPSRPTTSTSTLNVHCLARSLCVGMTDSVAPHERTEYRFLLVIDDVVLVLLQARFSNLLVFQPSSTTFDGYVLLEGHV